MKIQLLVAISDMDYASHFARVLAKAHGDLFEVALCTSVQKLDAMLENHLFDAALFSVDIGEACSLDHIRMPLLLQGEETLSETVKSIGVVRKYQRISSIVSDILEQYAKIDSGSHGAAAGKAQVTVVWSPYGGCGKTTVALAYAACQSVKGAKTTYLDLEPFSSTEIFFSEAGKSISTVFEKMEGNVELLLRSIEKQDTGSGIYYFSRPNNYDDINVLSVEDIALLIQKCAQCTERLIVDTAGSYDEKIRKLMELADEILLVIDDSPIGQEKLQQFRSQSDLFKKVQNKLTLVANRGASIGSFPVRSLVSLPQLTVKDPVSRYKTLSAGYFDTAAK